MPALRLRSRLALVAASLPLFFAGMPATTRAAAPATPVTDCAQARSLPADVDDESRRIACEIPVKYQHDVSMAEFVGRLIRLHDVAAWRTTDALVAADAFAAVSGEARGWLTLQGDERIEVRYYAQEDGQVRAIAAGDLDLRTVEATHARLLSPAEPVSAREQTLMKARDAALAAPGLTLCTNHPPNVVVVPSEEDARNEILVFVMSAWKDHNEAPLGGYHMFRFTPDGDTLLSQFSQTRSCPVADLDAKPAGHGEPVALAVTHLTSATPTMFHVFMNLQYGQPLYVITTQNGLHWRVDQGRIHVVPQPSGAQDDSREEPTDATP